PATLIDPIMPFKAQIYGSFLPNELDKTVITVCGSRYGRPACPCPGDTNRIHCGQLSARGSSVRAVSCGHRLRVVQVDLGQSHSWRDKTEAGPVLVKVVHTPWPVFFYQIGQRSLSGSRFVAACRRAFPQLYHRIGMVAVFVAVHKYILT